MLCIVLGVHKVFPSAFTVFKRKKQTKNIIFDWGVPVVLKRRQGNKIPAAVSATYAMAVEPILCLKNEKKALFFLLYSYLLA